MLDVNYDPATLFFSIVFSLIGIVYYYYGKKSGPYFRYDGIVLGFYPYFLNSLWLLITLGIVFTILPLVLVKLYPLDD